MLGKLRSQFDRMAIPLRAPLDGLAGAFEQADSEAANTLFFIPVSVLGELFRVACGLDEVLQWRVHVADGDAGGDVRSTARHQKVIPSLQETPLPAFPAVPLTIDRHKAPLLIRSAKYPGEFVIQLRVTAKGHPQRLRAVQRLLRRQ